MATTGNSSPFFPLHLLTPLFQLDRKVLASRRHPDSQISPAVDRLARIMTGVVGGLLLLASIITLSCLEELKSNS